METKKANGSDGNTTEKPFDFYGSYGYEPALHEDGAWTTIDGRFDVKICGYSSVRSTKALEEALAQYGGRDLEADPLDAEQDFEADMYRMAYGIVLDWGDNIPDPDTGKPVPFTPEDALRVFRKAGGFALKIKTKSLRFQTFQQRETQRLVGNSQGRSDGKKAANRSA